MGKDRMRLFVVGAGVLRCILAVLAEAGDGLPGRVSLCADPLLLLPVRVQKGPRLSRTGSHIQLPRPRAPGSLDCCRRKMPSIKGIAVAPGLVSGPIHVVRARPDGVPVWALRDEDVDAEISRLGVAVTETSTALEQRQQMVEATSGASDAGIFAVHRMVLSDPSALATVEGSIRDQLVNAEAAVQMLIDELQAKMSRLEGANVRGYAADLSEPWRGVLDVLLEHDTDELGAIEGGVVLAAAELTPQVVTTLARERVRAIVAETGGRFSHGAVLARSFGIPCVVGLPNLLARLEQNLPVLVDGDQGTVTLRPSQEAVQEFEERQRQRSAREEALREHAGKPSVTPDGHALEVAVNLESIRDLGTFEVEHCDGTGLLRTEFLYMERSEFPSEEEQYRLYRRVLTAMGDRPVTIRTLDIGGDKPLPYFKTPPEPNPQLGWRGLRVTLEWQDLFRVQLRALLRASSHGKLRLLLPMVTSLEEVQTAHRIFDEVREQLLEQGYEVAEDVPVGIMVEVPSSVWILDVLIREVDFVSVGSNDLTQYVLAVDRDNPFVSRLYEPLHPAVLRVLSHVAAVTSTAGKHASVCGEVAGDHVMALVLLGMGYQAVSVSPNFLAEVRFAVRETPFKEARDLALRVLSAGHPGEVREALEQARARLHRGLED